MRVSRQQQRSRVAKCFGNINNRLDASAQDTMSGRRIFADVDSIEIGHIAMVTS
jgi:hypothetical protein